MDEKASKHPADIFAMLANCLRLGDEEGFDTVLDGSSYEELVRTVEYAQGLNRVLLDTLARKEAAESILVVKQ